MQNNILKVFLSGAMLFLLGVNAYGQKSSFEISDGEFLYNGEAVPIYSGEMHYARIPKAYWTHRLKMMKAMGLNTVATYVFWNYHNTAPGVWDFKSGNKDLRAFIKAAEEEGMFVILRPGPYACAEWEFGGYPWWLQNEPTLEVRSNNQAFLDSANVYIKHLADEVKDLQVTKGGPIIMVQVENEFGSYVAQRSDIPQEEHQAYYEAIHQSLKDVGFEVPFFTSDGTWLFEGGALPGVLPTANGEGNVGNLKKAVDKYHGGKGPYMVAEFYPGWLDHWGEEFVRIGKGQIVEQTRKYLENGVNFNFYMVIGGTNFGFTSGANYNDEHDIQPDITSYDYDAPISEAGWATDKFMGIRELMKAFAPYEIPAIPEQIPVITLEEGVKMDKAVSLFDLKEGIKPVVNDEPMTFEELGQGHGYVLYSKLFNQPINGKLKVTGLRDFATVYVNGNYVGSLNRVNNEYELDINIPFNGRLELLVENMGRINYGAQIVQNTKGIISGIKINEYEITGNWKHYGFPMDKMPKVDNSGSSDTKPTLYFGKFDLENVGDIFLNMEKWGKGIVFVNGHNLGRYWSIGPQQTLYVPGAWLIEGENQICVFEQLNQGVPEVLETIEQPVLEKLSLD
ncbi:beta-galactosidase [Echinicola marina]|uniref:beta-galactosidase n=1 Tax=Echinicola marina TaxID=2859768 RepID=UPI001CF6D521|nr:beta-galactosidase [Echinicola marina]UCS91506.1 beta-galactosidase [Echinicola marina]